MRDVSGYALAVVEEHGHAEEITVDGETEPVVVKLGVWTSNARARCDKLPQEQLDALRKLGIDWAAT
ncbi:hypothetical protein ACJ6WF_41315 [Streptomyces sp. MMS24-I2-30]|uniref:hypothetical protein n=1 Tax=Streptomyces sp. MMS24-I2-30 TaxID=3351564 RepID=UPI003896B932